MSLLSLVALLSFASVEILEWFVGVPGIPLPFWLPFAGFFISYSGSVLSFAFGVYVFNSLREIRKLLREIAGNTRSSASSAQRPESLAESAWPAAPKPLIPTVPPEEAKYMPKQ